MSTSADAIHMARVYLAQARASRRHPGWHATLLRWAAQHRRAAAKARGKETAV